MHDPLSSVQNYRTCRQVLQGLSWDSYGDEWEPMRNLLYWVIGTRQLETCRSRAGYERAISNGLFEKAMMLRNIFVPIEDRYNRKTVFRDVYELATYISLSSGGQRHNSVIPRYFRGQTRKWPLVPSILRHCQNSAELSGAVERLTRFIRTLQEVRPDTTDDQAIAIAQHYSSKENGLWTWLIDVTRDPLVGLFFASYGGKTGDIGVLWEIREKEWNRLAGGGSNPMGALRAIEAPGIHRIRVQQGLFIEAPHPKLFDEYVPYLMEFDQVEGLVFEDDKVEFPITIECLLKDDDSLNTIIEKSVEHPALPMLSCPQRLHPVGTMSGADYLEIVSSWVQNKPEWRFSDDNRIVLTALCALHAKVHEMALQTSGAETLSDLKYLGSLHALWRAVGTVFDPMGASVLEQNYLSATGNKWLRGRLQELASDVLKARRTN